MRIIRKVHIGLGIFIVVSIGLLSTEIYKHKRDLSLIEQNELDEHRYVFGRLLKLKTQPLEMLVRDYSYWDELVEFVSTKDEEWARNSLDEALRTYSVSALWVYDKEFNPIYIAAGDREREHASVKVPAGIHEIAPRVFSGSKLVHFFLMGQDGLWEVRGATIHSGDDPQRRLAHYGYFFAAVLWGGPYVNGLEQLAGVRIAIEPAASVRPLFDKKKAGLVYQKSFFLPLAEWDGVARWNLHVLKDIPSLLLAHQRSVYYRIAILILIVLVLATAVFLNLSVAKPAGMIVRALKHSDSGYLQGVMNKPGEFGSIAGMMHDFFRQKEQIEASERRYRSERDFSRSIINAIAHPLYVIDVRTYRVLVANQAACARGEALASTCHTLTHRSERPCEGAHVCPLQKVVETGNPVTVEHVHYDRQGNPRYYEVYGYPITDASGAVVQMVEYNFDITERKLHEETIRNYTKMIEEVNRELDDFTYIVSHDLKEPLRAIDAFSKFVSDDFSALLSDDGKMYLGRIRANAERMRRLIDDLLEVSRIERIRNPVEEFEIGQIIADVKFRLEYLIGQREAEVVVNGPLPRVTGDKVRLAEVFVNLISNAVKFTEGKKPIVEIGCKENDEEFEFYVKDNGPGIEQKYFERIFEIFQRLSSSSSQEGTGAGLAIVKKIVKLHGGRVWVASEYGRGATFFFTIKKSVPPGDKALRGASAGATFGCGEHAEKTARIDS